MVTSVSLAQVNAFLWHRQHLAADSAGSDVVKLVEDLVALHATSPTTPYLSLRARLTHFELQDLDQALYLDRSVVKVLCMRQTVHAVSVRDVAHVLVSSRDPIQKATERELRQLAVWSGAADPGGELEILASWQHAVEEHLASHGSATAAEVTAAIPALQHKIHFSPDKPYGGLVSIGSMLLPRLTALGILVRGRPRGTWRSNLHEYELAGRWLPAESAARLSPEDARARLLQQYLAAFGPATTADAEWWTGWSKKETLSALASLGAEVTEVLVDDIQRSLYLPARDLNALLSTWPLNSREVRLLPCLDGYIMGYKDHTRFLDPAHREQVFDRSGNAYNTVWADGRVIGIWSEKDDALSCFLWEDGWDAEVLSEANVLARFLQQADKRSGKAKLPVRIQPCPDGLYVKTPFTLAMR